MWKIINFLFLLFACLTLHAGQDLEVRLSTKVALKPIYVSKLRLSDVQDSRALEDLRSLLIFDLSNNGFSSVLSEKETAEQKISSSHFDFAFWKQAQVSTVIVLDSTQNKLSATVFQIEKGAMKHYPEISVTGKKETDRPAIHRLADAMQKDLFGVLGIASCRLLFSERIQNNESRGPEWASDIWIADSDGANAKRLTFAKGYCMSPGFLPPVWQQSGYFFASSDRGQSKIYRASFQESKADVWIQLRGNQLLPSVAKNGSLIAFISDAAGRPDLFIQSLNTQGEIVGKARQLFTSPMATQASPTFSPDSRKLAFVSDKDGTPRIYLIDVSDAREHPKPTLITKKNRENTSPAWSPDGKKIAFSARTDGVRQIWIYDFVTEEEWQLTTGPENKENPSWAPDSLHLIYNTETHDVSELYVINLHQQEPVQLNLGFGQKRFASWEIR